MNGSIESDFPVTITRSLSRRQIEGTIGGGGPGTSCRIIGVSKDPEGRPLSMRVVRPPAEPAVRVIRATSTGMT
jgi:hypothetical protein